MKHFILRFEADDLELQDEPLQVRIMDYDAYSANDAIGKVAERKIGRFICTKNIDR